MKLSLNTNMPNNNPNNTLNKSKAPSFKATAEFSPEAIQHIERELTGFYNRCYPSARKRFFGDKPLNCAQIIKDFQAAFAEATQKIVGKLEYTPRTEGEFATSFLNLSLRGKDGELLKHKNGCNVACIDLLADNESEMETPLTKPVRWAVACASDIVANNKKGYGTENEFHKLLLNLWGIR